MSILPWTMSETLSRAGQHSKALYKGECWVDKCMKVGRARRTYKLPMEPVTEPLMDFPLGHCSVVQALWFFFPVEMNHVPALPMGVPGLSLETASCVPYWQKKHWRKKEWQSENLAELRVANLAMRGESGFHLRGTLAIHRLWAAADGKWVPEDWTTGNTPCVIQLRTSLEK
jgi:hypothetical protein